MWMDDKMIDTEREKRKTHEFEKKWFLVLFLLVQNYLKIYHQSGNHATHWPNLSHRGDTVESCLCTGDPTRSTVEFWRSIVVKPVQKSNEE
mmetsp:Transcript_40995/g.45801  ORF Transcript_40995/g.45801 Transcript_40995/m.45801 type:complete len:91 (-) Transcript_40995:798-1070(-)